LRKEEGGRRTKDEEIIKEEGRRQTDISTTVAKDSCNDSTHQHAEKYIHI
jgi:hypothetical protein